MNDEYDLVIIGWGAAGFAAAIKASEITSGQARIALIGDGPLGGTCVNFGCVPSKYLIEAAAEAHAGSRHRGVSLARPSVDFRELMNGLREAVAGERTRKYEQVIARYENVELIHGRASFVNDREVVVNGRRISGYNFLVSTGSSPVIPDVPGISEFMTTNNFWNMSEMPSTLVIIGGGAAGLEIGQAMSRLGSEVHIVEPRRLVPPHADPDASSIIARSLQADGVRLHLGFTAARAEDGYLIIKGNGEELRIRADAVLVSAGRTPNVEGLNLDAARVAYGKNGVATSRTMQTSNPRIYAAGDVVAQRFMLETLAAREGAVAAENMYEHLGIEVNELEFPRALFTQPQMASVGTLEDECAGCRSKSVPLESVPRARIAGDTDGLFKVVVDREGRVVGVHVVAPNASEIIVEGAMAVRHGLSLSDIVDQPHVFPTISEGIKLAAQSFSRNVEDMPCCVE